jgi:hypothetical protein
MMPGTMAGSKEMNDIVGGSSPELVPVVEPDAAPLASPTLSGAGDDIAIGDLLSDALFGEVIDISDLIPRLQPGSGEALVPGFAAASALPEPGSIEAGDVLAVSGHAALTILYDDDILASDGTIL